MARRPTEERLRVERPTRVAAAAARSHLSDGRVVCWYGEPGVVIDAELTDRPVPPALMRRFGAEGFWARWTRAECAAKLADVPMAIWLHDHGLTAGPYDVITLTYEPEPGIVVALGRRPVKRAVDSSG
ncbi:MAG TPA: hypothetical protein VFE45_14265 [Coriobacteriia bacterium]|nr:hypothetical protein [Coriobacteriia bacterium]